MNVDSCAAILGPISRLDLINLRWLIISELHTVFRVLEISRDGDFNIN